jgi:uncharacterized protein YbjT (DUF2867 family)
VVRLLRAHGDDVVVASRSTGVDAVQNVGLESAFHGADVVVDVTNAAIYNEAEVVDYFTSVTQNVAAAEQRAGVGHHVALGIVGMDRIAASGYLAGKAAQERALAGSGIPSTIVRATQFFEFLRRAVSGGASRPVVEDADARYFGVDVGADALVPLGTFTTGRLDYATWQQGAAGPSSDA